MIEFQSIPNLSFISQILKQICLLLMTVYVFTLLVDFDELLDFDCQHKDDQPVKLSDHEIDEIGKRVKQKMNMTD